MSNETIIRAWKDAGFRQSLSDAQRGALPANPAGVAELNDGVKQNIILPSHPVFCGTTHPYTCF
jgi:mersacidin/lichenicidin family type 2 lantibiotic